MRCLILLICFIGWIIPNTASAQGGLVQLDRHYIQDVERSVAGVDQSAHTAVKPFVKSRFDLTHVNGFSKDSSKYYEAIGAKLFRDHLLQVKTEGFFLAIDPLFDFSMGLDAADTSNYADTVRLYNNVRGLLIQGKIGRDVSFASGFYESQSFFPTYYQALTDSFGAVPGMGRTKVFQNAGFDYNMSFGNVMYEPTSWLTLQMGYGKHFIGHGYRSLLLSDASFCYPYLNASAELWKDRIVYTTIFAGLQTLDRLPLGEVPEALFRKKGGSFHYLGFILHPRIELGLFEGVVWDRYGDSTMRALPWNVYTPIIGLNTFVNGLDRRDNSLLGVNIKVKIWKKLSIYGQLALDNPAEDRTGFQLGIKAYDLGLKNLDIMAEWNSTSSFFYASAYSDQSYSHFNQPLGLPQGSGVNEWVAMINYRYKRWLVGVKYNSYEQKRGPMGNWDDNPDWHIIQIYHEPLNVAQWDVSLAYNCNPKTNFQIFAAYTDRLSREVGTMHTQWFRLGFRTQIHNRYYDI